MQQHEIHNYLYNFFEANNCEILERSPHLLDVQLTIEMDKLLMNRPFIGTILRKQEAYRIRCALLLLQIQKMKKMMVSLFTTVHHVYIKFSNDKRIRLIHTFI